MNQSIKKYLESFENEKEKEIGLKLSEIISEELPNASSKIWHAHPVWFINENPIVGFSKQKAGIRLMFWSGADFDEPELAVRGEKFKDASLFYQNPEEINHDKVKRWLQKSINIQWDYKNLVKRKGKLEKLNFNDSIKNN